MGTEQRQTFNHIVDLRQRAMALELGRYLTGPYKPPIQSSLAPIQPPCKDDSPIQTSHTTTYNQLTYKRSFSYSETDVDGELAYLIVTKVPSLRGSEVRGATDKETLENLYERRRIGRQIDHSNQDLISYEQIGYLFKREVGYAKSIAEDKYTPGDESLSPPFFPSPSLPPYNTPGCQRP